MSKHNPVSYARATLEARNLKTEDNSNPEYDRALVELIWDMFGVDRATVAKDLGLALDNLYRNAGPSR